MRRSVLREELTPNGSVIYEDFYEDVLPRRRTLSVVSDDYLPRIPSEAASFIDVVEPYAVAAPVAIAKPVLPVAIAAPTIVDSVVGGPISVVEEVEALAPTAYSVQTVQTVRTVVPVLKRRIKTVPVTHTVVRTVPVVQTVVTAGEPYVEVNAMDPVALDAADGVIDGTYFGAPIYDDYAVAPVDTLAYSQLDYFPEYVPQASYCAPAEYVPTFDPNGVPYNYYAPSEMYTPY
jgi:hypothetical protein